MTEWRMVPAGEPCECDLFDDTGRCRRCLSPRPVAGTAHLMPEMVEFHAEYTAGWARGLPGVDGIVPLDARVLVTPGTSRRLTRR